VYKKRLRGPGQQGLPGDCIWLVKVIFASLLAIVNFKSATLATMPSSLFLLLEGTSAYANFLS